MVRSSSPVALAWGIRVEGPEDGDALIRLEAEGATTDERDESNLDSLTVTVVEPNTTDDEQSAESSCQIDRGGLDGVHPCHHRALFGLTPKRI